MDSWLIDKFERFAHKFQRLTGLDCFWLGRNAYVLKFLLLVTLIVLNAIKLKWLTVPWLTNVPFTWQEIRSVEKLIKNYDPSSKTGNPRKIDDTYRVARYMTIAMLCLDIPFAIFIRDFALSVLAIWALAWFMGAYFSTCDPLPPCESKIRQWVKGLRAKPLVTQEQL